MNMDRRSLLAVVLCVIFYLGYTQYLQKKYPNYGKPAVTEVESSPAPTPSPLSGQEAGSVKGTPKIAGESQNTVRLSEDQLRFETRDMVLQFDQDKSAISSIKLKNYKPHKNSPESDRYELVDLPLGLAGTVKPDEVHEITGFSAVRTDQGLALTKDVADWRVMEEFTVPPEGYNLKIKLTFENTSPTPKELSGGLIMTEGFIKSKLTSSSFFGSRETTSFIEGIGGGRDAVPVKEFCKDDAKDDVEKFRKKGESFDFIGIDKHYFLVLMRPMSGKMDSTLKRANMADGNICHAALTLRQNLGLVPPGEKVSLEFNAYLGPKDVGILKAHDSSLAKTVDFGYFSVIAYPLLLAIKTFDKYVGNYGVSIIILTALLKLLFYPLTKAAAVSMKRMQKLQPQMNQIKEKFKSDPQRQQKELMAFMSKNKVNPAKGCLPILPQIPVFIAFYNVLSQAIELRQAPFMGWIMDLSIADPYYITPLILGAGMFVQQKLTPNPGMDKTQARVMMMMPVIFTVMMLSMPAGMVIYMLTNTFISIGQQQWLNRKLDRLNVETVV